MICNDRLNGNPENTVGVLAMAGQGGYVAFIFTFVSYPLYIACCLTLSNIYIMHSVDLITSPTENQTMLLASLAKVKLHGQADFSSAVQIAQLALKYRKNNNGGKRIIVFVGSPVAESVEVLELVALGLKKTSIAVDIISIGEFEENEHKLVSFVNIVNTEDNSHLISVPAGVLPSDAILASPIMMTQHGFGSGSAGGGGFGGAGAASFEEYGGYDPTLDPDLAMAIRVSIEEDRAREEARLQEGKSNGQAIESGNVRDDGHSHVHQEHDHSTCGGHHGHDTEHTTAMSGIEDEDALLQRALEMSIRDSMVISPYPSDHAHSDDHTGSVTEADEDEVAFTTFTIKP